MFGWLKKKVRNDHIRLVVQNQLAVEYLYDFSKQVYESTLNPSMMRMLEEVDEIQVELVEKLKIQAELEVEIFDDQFNLQKQLRSMYDEKKSGQVAFAKTFGSASERIMSFDQRFQPNEGWKIFLSHFDNSSSVR